MFKVLAFVAGSMLGATAIIDAIAKPQYDQVRDQYQQTYCAKLGPNASIIVSSCN